jgi:membrane-associated HD superfamily phosphohydrolase
VLSNTSSLSAVWANAKEERKKKSEKSKNCPLVFLCTLFTVLCSLLIVFSPFHAMLGL